HRRHHRAHRPHHEALDPAVTSTYLKGVDVSHWEGHVNWAKVKAAGIDFAFAKATDGLHGKDHTFSTNWAGMKAAGLVRGAFHWGHPATSEKKQAKRFHKAVVPDAGDLPLALDLEDTDGKGSAKIWTWTEAFLAEIESLTGKPAFVYVGTPFWKEHTGNH